jgi:hypothetical protein
MVPLQQLCGDSALAPGGRATVQQTTAAIGVAPKVNACQLRVVGSLLVSQNYIKEVPSMRCLPS